MSNIKRMTAFITSVAMLSSCALSVSGNEINANEKDVYSDVQVYDSYSYYLKAGDVDISTREDFSELKSVSDYSEAYSDSEIKNCLAGLENRKVIEVPLEFKYNVGFYSMSLDFSAASELTFVGIKNDISFEDTETEVSSNEKDCRITVIRKSDKAENIVENGVFAVLLFALPEDPSFSEYVVELSDYDAFELNNMSTTNFRESGYIRIGDVGEEQSEPGETRKYKLRFEDTDVSVSELKTVSEYIGLYTDGDLNGDGDEIPDIDLEEYGNRKVVEVPLYLDENFGIFTAQIRLASDLEFMGVLLRQEEERRGDSIIDLDYMVSAGKNILLVAGYYNAEEDLRDFRGTGKLGTLLYILPEDVEDGFKYSVGFNQKKPNIINSYYLLTDAEIEAVSAYVSVKADTQPQVTTAVTEEIIAPPETTVTTTPVTTVTTPAPTTPVTTVTTPAPTKPVTTVTTPAPTKPVTTVTTPAPTKPVTTVTTPAPTKPVTTVTTPAPTKPVTTVTTPVSTTPVTTVTTPVSTTPVTTVTTAGPTKPVTTVTTPAPTKPVTTVTTPTPTKPVTTVTTPAPTKPVTTVTTPAPTKPVTTVTTPAPTKPVTTVTTPAPTKPVTTVTTPAPTKPVTTVTTPAPTKPVTTVTTPAPTKPVTTVTTPAPTKPVTTVTTPAPTKPVTTVTTPVSTTPVTTVTTPVSTTPITTVTTMVSTTEPPVEKDMFKLSLGSINVDRNGQHGVVRTKLDLNLIENKTGMSAFLGELKIGDGTQPFRCSAIYADEFDGQWAVNKSQDENGIVIQFISNDGHNIAASDGRFAIIYVEVDESIPDGTYDITLENVQCAVLRGESGQKKYAQGDGSFDVIPGKAVLTGKPEDEPDIDITIEAGPDSKVEIPVSGESSKIVISSDRFEMFYSHDTKALKPYGIKATLVNENGETDITEYLKVSGNITPAKLFDPKNRSFAYDVSLSLDENEKISSAVSKAFEGTKMKVYIVKKGDLNLDNETDTRDATDAIQAYLISRSEGTPEGERLSYVTELAKLAAQNAGQDNSDIFAEICMFAGDVTEEGVLDTRDATKIIAFYNDFRASEDKDAANSWNNINVE